MNPTDCSPLPVTVVRHEPAAHGIVRLQLRHEAGIPLPAWEPGAHIDLLLPGGLVRQYSLCGDPARREIYQIAVLEEPLSRGGSRAVCGELREGSALSISAPRQLFPLEPARRYLFIAGGIGITPILPMVRAAAAAGADWRLVYGGRERRSMAFLAELDRYGDRVEIAPQDEVGLLDLDRWLKFPGAGVLIYACGPESLLQALEQHSAHWPRGSLHVERFAPRPQNTEAVDAPFQVELRRTGTTLDVGSGQSILEVLDAAGIPTLSACGEGTCGTCWTRVIAGTPLHRDSLLDDEQRAAGDQMLICVSRSCTARLVLDL